MVSEYLPKDAIVFIHAENGIVGVGPNDPESEYDPFRTDAGENPVSIIQGGSIIDSCVSFGLARGGHLTATVLGAMQVDAEGNLANWMIPGGKIAGMGGAMDLVSGAREVIIATEHCSKDGTPKILNKCTFPLTGRAVVNTIVTELAYIKVTNKGLVLKEIASGVSVEEVVAKTGAQLIIDPDIIEMKVW